MEESIDYEDVFKYTSNGVLVTDKGGIITHVNAQAREILGFDSAAIVGESINAVLPRTGRLVQKCLQGREPILGQQVLGEKTEFMLNVTPVFRQDRVIGAVCNFQKLSLFESSAQRTQSYQALNRQLETIFQASSDGIWVCDGSGRIISINKASEKLNGISSAEIVGKNVVDLLETKIFDKSVTTRVMASRKRETVMQYIPKTNKFLLSTGTPSLDEQGNIALIVINERDMTELNALRRSYEQSQKVKEKYQEELSELTLRELERNSIVADSSKMRNIHQMALKLSNIGASNILILGESGTGKGLLAKLIHKSSKRRARPFVEINCAALPENLLEAELFGYEKGAFTGASDKGKVGLIELAQGGTLFLDEIGDMPILLQSKLLKYLDDQEIRRIGGTESIKISCSTIAATNQNLSKLVTQKEFREDLYYRLSSFILELPPLKERIDDIPGLVRFYLNQFNSKYEVNKSISPHGIRFLQKYPFPGNIRELKSIIENAVVMSETSRIDEFVKISTLGDKPGAGDQKQFVDDDDNLNLVSRLENLERHILQSAKDRFQTTREIAAQVGISQPSVVRKLQKYEIN